MRHEIVIRAEPVVVFRAITEPRDPERGGTRVIAVQSGFGLGGDWDVVFKTDSGGWPYHLALLKWAVEEGFDHRTLPYLGFWHDPAPGGLAVTGVPEGTPAHRAGLLPGDRVTRVNGRPVSSLLTLGEALRLTPARPGGVPVDVLVERAGRPLSLTVMATPRTA